MNLLNLKTKKGIFTKFFVLLPLLIIFFIPQSVFAGVLSGLEEGKPKDLNGDAVCFQITYDEDMGPSEYNPAGEKLTHQETYCFADIATCQSKIGQAGSYEILSQCKDYASLRTPLEKAQVAVSNAGGILSWIGKGLLDGIGWVIGQVFKFIAWIFFKIAGWWLWMAAFTLDEAITRTIMPSTYNGLGVVHVGWTLLRDVANMSFIFVLLYISMQTVLGIADGKTKKWFVNIVFAALLINFSLFGTQVVIDASNIMATGFWDKIHTRVGTTEVSGISTQFVEAFKIQSIVDAGNASNDIGPFDMAMIYGGGALIMFIAGSLFLTGASMMIARIVQLLFLMIASPLAVLGYVIPQLKAKITDKWWHHLLGQAFVAPVFIFMLYLNSVLIQSMDLVSLTGTGATGDTKFAEAFGGQASHMTIYYNFMIIIFLLGTSMTVASAVSSEGAAAAIALKKKAGGYGASVVGASGRKLGGGVGKKLSDSAGLRSVAARGGVIGGLANIGLATGEKMRGGSWDVRNAPGGEKLGLGKGSDKSYGKNLDKQKAKDAETVKQYAERYKKDPKALETQLRAKFGTKYDSDDMKGAREEVKKASVLARNKEVAEKLDTDLKSHLGDLPSVRKESEEADALLTATEKQMREAEGDSLEQAQLSAQVNELRVVANEKREKLNVVKTNVAQTVKKMSGDKLAENKDAIKNSEVQKNMGARHIAAAQKKMSEGDLGSLEESDTLLKDIEKNSGNDNAKRYIGKQKENGLWPD